MGRISYVQFYGSLLQRGGLPLRRKAAWFYLRRPDRAAGRADLRAHRTRPQPDLRGLRTAGRVCDPLALRQADRAGYRTGRRVSR